MKQENKHKTASKRKTIGLSIALIVLLMLSLSNIYIRFIKRLTYENVYNNISELSEQTATGLNQSITNQMKFVDIMIDFINGGYVETTDAIFKRFAPDLESYHFTRLVVLDEFGNGITSDGYKVNNYENIEEFFNKEDIYLSENRKSTVSDEQVNIYSKTFYLKGQKLVLFATINTEKYKEILSRRLFNGEGGTYLVNNDGTILIDSFDKITQNNVNLYDYMKKEYKLTKKGEIAKINNMSKNIKANQKGTFDISFDKNVYFIHYETINVNDWYVVTIAPDNIIAKELNTFVSLSLGLCFIMNLLIIGVFIYLYIANQKGQKKLYKTAYIDPITELGNEIYFKENSNKWLLKPDKNKYIMIFDINKFKLFNKIYDYEFCNQILKELGIKATEKLPKDSIISRLSRDIFAASFTYDKKIEELIKELFQATQNIKIENINIRLNLSMGIYKLNKEDKDINKILDKAYLAHSQIKGIYDGNYYIFDEQLENKMLEEQKIEATMENALENNEFKIVYQPKISVGDESLAGAEALVRWHKENDIISPNKFIPLFEKNKFILKLDLYIFEKVCKDIAAWKKKYQNVPVISVNVSKEHFIKFDFIDEYTKIADKYGIDRNKIDLEITESTTIDENIDVLKIITYIKEKGFLISIDDFGTGYSSLSMLQNMPIDIIKIDKTFIDNADLTSNKNIINHIVYIAKQLDKKTIIEGVETKEQVEFVKKIESDIVQGYYYSKPINKQEFETYFAKHQ